MDTILILNVVRLILKKLKRKFVKQRADFGIALDGDGRSSGSY
jgi:phosphomannomutase